jgi:hypothetical protein
MKTNCFYLFLLLFTLAACNYESDYEITPDKADKIISLEDTTTATLFADGADTIAIKVLLDEDASAKKTTVVFKTTAGTFLESKADSALVKPILVNNAEGEPSMVAVVRLKSSLKIEDAIVNARTGNVKTIHEKKVRFVQAYPTRIAVDKSAFLVKSFYNGEVTVTAKVSRDKGQPSIGTTVRFWVKDINDKMINSLYPRLLDATTDENGQASVVYGARDSTNLGDIKIYASTNKSNHEKDTISSFTVLTVLK